MKKSDWLLVFSCLSIVLYIWVAIGYSVAGVFSTETAKMWLGSFSSFAVGFLALLGWSVLAAARVIFCGKEVYTSLHPGGKKLLHKYLRSAAYELWSRALRRKDKAGNAARFIERVMHGA